MIVSNGVISGFAPAAAGLPNTDYFVSAKIDSGNSGGIAFSKDRDGLCILGIPTWVSQGNFENAGLIQNMSNIYYVP